MKHVTITKVISHVVFATFSICCLIPLILLLSSSFTSSEELTASGLQLIPKQMSFVAWKLILNSPQRIIKAFGVSCFVTIVGTAINLLMCTMAAYPLSRSSFSHKGKISFFFYFTQLFSGGMAPYYILVSKYLKMNNSLWVMIIPIMASPFIIFLMRTYLRSIPETLYEAAKLDGVNEYKMFFNIVLPISIPALATGGFIIVLGYWNEWYNGMLFVTDPNKFSLQMLLQNLLSYVEMIKKQQTTSLANMSGSLPSNGIISGTCIIAITPVLLVFVLFQKYLIKGITAGAVKE